MPKQATAFSPAGISSFFEICDKKANGEPIANLEQVGARGGGFVIQKGVLTKVTVSEAKTNSISIIINGRIAPEADTTRAVSQILLNETNEFYDIIVDHKVDVPIGAGFGSSAAGALTAGLALSKALNLSLTYNQIGKIAHVAEVQCKTGLGTVGPLMLGGCIVTVEPGAPGKSVIDRIPLSDDYTMVTGTFGAIQTKKVLASAQKRIEINRWGRKTLNAILDDPSLENFMTCCLDFAEKAGFMTLRAKRLVQLAEKAGAVGVAQNMVGEAVHALTLKKNTEEIAEAFNQVLPKKRILTTKIDFQGARLLGNEEV